MKKMILITALLLGAWTSSWAEEGAQQPQNSYFRWPSTDFAATYTTERAQVATGNCCFWLQGGSAEAAIGLYRGLGIAANLTGQHNSNITPGVSLDSITFMAGPRYTLRTVPWAERVGIKRETAIFGEALFGGIYAFNSVFPNAAGTVDHASSSAMQVGGGLNVAVSKQFGLRALEVDYVRTSLPNNGTNSQNHLRLAIGVSYHLNH